MRNWKWTCVVVLALSLAAAAQSKPVVSQPEGCKAQQITWTDSEQKEHKFWIVAPPASIDIAGRYLYERQGHPIVVLGAEGNGGEFEVHGAPKPQYQFKITRWWLQAQDCSGELVKQEGPAGARYTLVLELDRPYQGELGNRISATVFNDGRRLILGERERVK